MVICTCIYKIVTSEQEAPEIRTVYWATMTATASAWLPSFALEKQLSENEIDQFHRLTGNRLTRRGDK